MENVIERLIAENIKTGKIKRCVMLPMKDIPTGEIGYLKVVEGGAIHKQLLNNGVNPFKIKSDGNN